MDIASLSTGLSGGAVSLDVNVAVLKAVQNADAAVGQLLAASIGLGNNVDAFA